MGELNSALSSGKDVKLSSDIDMSNSSLKIENNNTFDGNGYTLNSDKQVVITTTGGTIKNLVIDGEGEPSENGTDSKRGIFNNGENGNPKATSDVNIENVQFLNLGYAFNLYAVESETANLYMTDCKIQGWSSFTGFDAAFFTDCEFIRGTYHNDPLFDGAIRPYDDVTFEDCDFAQDFKIANDLGYSL